MEVPLSEPLHPQQKGRPLEPFDRARRVCRARSPLRSPAPVRRRNNRARSSLAPVRRCDSHTRSSLAPTPKLPDRGDVVGDGYGDYWWPYCQRITPCAPTLSISSPTELSNATLAPLPIVGIGASAGGIEALNTCSPASARTAASRTSSSPISPGPREPAARGAWPLYAAAGHGRGGRNAGQARDGSTSCPARMILGIADGHLRLREHDPDQRERNPIDLFFSELAQACGDYAVGVILSGGGNGRDARAEGDQGARRPDLRAGHRRHRPAPSRHARQRDRYRPRLTSSCPPTRSAQSCQSMPAVSR